MPYIVKSSLDIGGKVVSWNEQEVNKLIKEKEEKLEILEKQEENNEKELEKVKETKTQTKIIKSDKKKEKAGDK